MSQSASIAKVNHWHQQLALYLISNPTATNVEVAAHFQVSSPWLSTVKNSDAFRDYFAQLQSQHASAVLLTVRDKQLGLADQVLSELQNRVALDAPGFSHRELLDVADVMLKHQPQTPQAPQGLNVVVVSADVLEKARAELRAPKNTELQAEVGGRSRAIGASVEDASYIDLPGTPPGGGL